MPTPPIPTRHHLVSQGYQKNFADSKKRLTVLGARNGRVVEALRPAKRNWVEKDWNSFIDLSGMANPHLELEFAKVEASAMRSVREVTVRGPTPRQKAAIVSLFAMHLARSRSFVAFRDAIYNDALPGIISELTRDQHLIERFETELGRHPKVGELHEFIVQHAEQTLLTKAAGLRSVAENHNKFVDKLNGFDLQIVEVAERLPGFVLADVPIVHANLGSRRFGFRDGLAIGDADLVAAPLTRRCAAFFVAKPQPHTTLTSKKSLQRVNALFIRAAIEEVACHPDDALETSRVCRNLPPVSRP